MSPDVQDATMLHESPRTVAATRRPCIARINCARAQLCCREPTKELTGSWAHSERCVLQYWCWYWYRYQYWASMLVLVFVLVLTSSPNSSGAMELFLVRTAPDFLNVSNPSPLAMVSPLYDNDDDGGVEARTKEKGLRRHGRYHSERE